MKDKELLAEVEDLLRTMPPLATIRHPTKENQNWLGRVMAVIGQWNNAATIQAQGYLNDLLAQGVGNSQRAFQGMSVLLHQACHELRMKTVGPLSVLSAVAM